MNKIILKKFLKTKKNILTRDSSCVYDEIATDSSVVERRKLQDTGGQPPIINEVVFLCPVGNGYVQAQAKDRFACNLYRTFSNRRTPNFDTKCLALLLNKDTGENTMTKIINNQKIRAQYKNNLSTLQMLFKLYMELKVNWYKGEYTSEQESVFGAVHTALLNALITLPIIVPADKQVKLNLLRDITAFNCENSEGDYDLDNATGCEAEAFNLIDQLLAA